MDTSEMRAFVCVAEHQSFSGAAAVLGLTPSAVSKLISRLEERLGIRLIHRTTRRVSMTSEGDVYFARARQILADIDEMEMEVARSRGSPRGHLRVNTSTGFGIHQLAPALPEFLACYPDIDVELSIADRVVDLVADHADMTIRSGPIVDTSVTARKIADYNRVICAAPDYIAQHGVPRAPADLANHACIGMAFQTPVQWEFRMRSEMIQNIDIAPRVTTDNAETALRLALAGAGIVRLADIMVGEPIRRRELVPLLMDVHHAEPIALSALYLAGRHRLPKVRVFLEFLIGRFGSAPWRP
jgi:DNA-binding transcriptional LysR family regulator